MKVRNITTSPQYARQVLCLLFGEAKASEVIESYTALNPETYQPRNWVQRFAIIAAQAQKH